MADASGGLTRWAREYETIYILRPDVTGEESERVASRVAEIVDRLAGKITKVDNWGKRRLAYTIAKNTRGIFVYARYVGYNDLVAEIERNLRLLDSVIRFQTIVIGDMVDLAKVEVDPEEVKFVAIEESADEEPEPDAAERLGMYDQARAAARGVEPEGEEAAASEEEGGNEKQGEGETE